MTWNIWHIDRSKHTPLVSDLKKFSSIENTVASKKNKRNKPILTNRIKK